MKTSQETFETEMLKATSNLEDIKLSLSKLNDRFQLNTSNWGYVGSLNHVNELLKEIKEFLG